MFASDRQRVLQEIKTREEIDLANNRLSLAEKRKAIREAIPYTSWTKFLQHKATQGHETALAVLRSKKVKPSLAKSYSNDKIMADLEAVKHSKERQMEILQRQGLSQKHRRALMAVVKMQELIAKDPELQSEELKYNIDTKGTVIFTLKTGGTIRGTGKELHFSGHDQAAQKLAQGLARMKWGRNVTADGSVLHRLNDKNQF